MQIAEKILFNVVAFFLFIFIFFKMIRKNDTNYVSILILQAIGISINFIEILTKLYANVIIRIVMYIFAVVLPIIILITENRGHNFSEYLSYWKAKFFVFLKDDVDAKDTLVKMVTLYPKSYIGHKMLGEIYEREGRNEKSN